MRYLLIVMTALSFGACQNPKIETLKAEKEGLIEFAQKETARANEAEHSATEAEAIALLAQAAAQNAMQNTREAEDKANEQIKLVNAELRKCQEGK